VRLVLLKSEQFDVYDRLNHTRLNSSATQSQLINSAVLTSLRPATKRCYWLAHAPPTIASARPGNVAWATNARYAVPVEHAGFELPGEARDGVGG